MADEKKLLTNKNNRKSWRNKPKTDALNPNEIFQNPKFTKRQWRILQSQMCQDGPEAKCSVMPPEL